MLVIHGKQIYEYVDPEDVDDFEGVVWDVYELNTSSQFSYMGLDYSVTGIVDDDIFQEWDDKITSIYIFGTDIAYLRLDNEEEIEEFREKQAEYVFEEDIELYMKNANIFHEARGSLLHIPVRAVW